ncbi:XRE family transcriptional regulator [Paenibacillus anaericanus]|uniref:XRE family transcriptional regulator n=2 Tax=Paenibacillus anaericanus TaxID=170367 RepID=A0A3S1K917_9BACL|nr:helix-turn-helix transcriptional regulator [Paenibacillus anaericanus]RUT46631.1 XRE family transcriptional regulator [Paenibacillus anaericanus]
MSIYDRIEILIKNKKITKKKFCMDLGISTGNLGDWKRGKSTPGSNKLIDIAMYFDVSLDWLMTGHERQVEKIHERLEVYLVDVSSIDWTVKLSAHEKAFIREYIHFTQHRKMLRRKKAEKEK